MALVASFGYRLPHPEWRPPVIATEKATPSGSTSASEETAPAAAEETTMSVDANTAMRTSQVR